MTGLSTTNVWVLTDSKAGHKNQCLDWHLHWALNRL